MVRVCRYISGKKYPTLILVLLVDKALRNMASPATVPDVPQDFTMMTVSHLVGDKAVVGQIIELAKNEDDPPLIIGWNDTGLEEFWIKASRYGALPEAILPPNMINGGNHLVGPSTGTGLRDLKVWILRFLQAQINPPPAIVGETACLACTQNQFAHVAMYLVSMSSHPWFVGVLGHGAMSQQPLGSVWHPRADSSIGGECEQIHCPTVLWV
jgi:hypothetical protein